MADRRVTTRLDANVSGYIRGMAEAKAATAALNREINTSNDHMAWMAGSFLALAPAAVPIGATIVPAVAALATQAGLAAAAGGVMALAFVGVGDGLKALNDYQLDPTTENLKQLNEEMKKLGPDGREFVNFLDSIGPQFNELRMAARGGMFPGIEEGITAFMDRLPDLKRVITEISTTIGTLATDAGQGLAGPEFDEFFEFLKTDAGPILLDTGRALGNFIDGLASMTVAFGPTTKDFSAGLLDMSRRFEQWSESLSSSQGFQEFIDYVREVTPQVKSFLGQLVDTFVELSVAAAPIGGPMLRALTAMLNIVGQIAMTPVGSLLIAVTAISSLYGRLIALRNLASGGIVGSLVTGQFLALGKAADGASKKVAASGTAVAVAGSKWRTAGTLGLFALGSSLSLVETKSKDASAAFSILGGMATGAAVGTAILPGWGTAIGTVGGAVYGVVDALGDAKQATEQAQLAAEEWADAMLSEQQRVIDRQNLLNLLLNPDATPKPDAPDGPSIKFTKPGGKQTVTTEYKTLGAQASVQQATRVARAANMTPRNVRTWLTTIGWSPAKINAVVYALERARSLARVRATLSQFGWSTTKIDQATKALEGANSKSQVRARLTMTKNFTPEQIDMIAGLFDTVGEKNPKPKITATSNAEDVAAESQAFMDSVENVTRTITIEKRTVTKPAMGGAIQHFADGGFPWDTGAARAYGAISGPGTETSDSIPAMLSNGEHVLTASDVTKAGGQDAIYRLRAGIQSGALQFATGGGVSRTAPSSSTPAEFTARLADNRVQVTKGGLLELIDDRVMVSMGAVDTHARQAVARRRG